MIRRTARAAPRALTLSDAQREQIRGILDQQRQSGTDPAGKRQAERALQGLWPKYRISRRSNQPIVTQLGPHGRAEPSVELMQKIAQVLTPAQRR